MDFFPLHDIKKRIPAYSFGVYSGRFCGIQRRILSGFIFADMRRFCLRDSFGFFWSVGGLPRLMTHCGATGLLRFFRGFFLFQWKNAALNPLRDLLKLAGIIKRRASQKTINNNWLLDKWKSCFGRYRLLLHQMGAAAGQSVVYYSTKTI